ncbi:MAG TPA: hypothetical protein VFP59_16640 [Candidatus Angelobacter sp.]|nr:hypothetical protein [Candidatus Angelobacter sp.]
MLRFLRKNSAQVRICMESTGLYGLDAALALHRAAARQGSPTCAGFRAVRGGQTGRKSPMLRTLGQGFSARELPVFQLSSIASMVQLER